MKKILIVDDAAFMRMSLRNIMEESGFQVVGEAENGKVAVEKYNKLHPDIVTLNITMPEMDGLTALKKIMSIDPKANVIIVSAMGQEYNVREALKIGAKNFIVKPINKEHVLKVLNAL
jgi:two-component system chemotaxis response regulator CheY